MSLAARRHADIFTTKRRLGCMALQQKRFSVSILKYTEGILSNLNQLKPDTARNTYTQTPV